MKFSADNPFARPQPANRLAKRLGVALLIAAMVHLAAIFSLDWELKQTPELSQSLDVTLVSFSSGTAAGTATATADDDASDAGRPFMGDNHSATPTLTPTPTTSDSTTAASTPEPEPEPEVKAQSKPVVKAQPDPTPKPQPKPKPKPQVQKPKPATSLPKTAAQPNTARQPLAFGRDQLSASLAGIQADKAFARQQPNQGPRISRHHQATSKRDVSAWYRDAWRKKVERIGNLNYPEEARRQGLYGNLRMRVLINRDGSLQEMRVLQSSGHKVLDQAALNIVRLSAPFAPFSNELAAQYEQVEIIRTWRFERGDRLSSQ